MRKQAIDMFGSTGTTLAPAFREGDEMVSADREVFTLLAVMALVWVAIIAVLILL